MTAFTGYGILPEVTNALFSKKCRIIVRVAKTVETVAHNTSVLTGNEGDYTCISKIDNLVANTNDLLLSTENAGY